MDVTDILSFKTIPDAQISPDGRRVAYVVNEIDVEQDEYRSTIWVVASEGGEPLQFTRGPKRDSAPRWSPDGEQLAFLSDRANKHPQLHVMPAGGGEPRRLTALDAGVGPATWSPDSRQISFSARVWLEPPPADADARKRWEQRPRHVTRAQYKADGQGYTFGARWHLFLIDPAGGEPKQITDGEGDDRGEAWSPDGRLIAFSRTRDGTGEYSWSDIQVLDVASGETHRVSDSIGRAVSPTWSPDARSIACYGTDVQEPWVGDPMVRVWIVPSAGGAGKKLTERYDRGVVMLPPPAVTPGPVWSPDGGSVTFIAADRGNAHVVRTDVRSGETRVVVGGERQVACANAASGKEVAFVAGDLTRPADVYACDWDGRGERRLTELNRELLARLGLPVATRRTFANPNGGTVEGWLLLPPERRGPAPLLVDIHGGPAGFAGNLLSLASFHRYVLASRGWAVLALNPTGSGSYGRQFAHGIRGRWGEHDLKEQLAAVDALIAEGVADPDHLAVTGYSYGGFMTSWTIGHTDRFKAAVVGAPVTNQESFHGTSDIGMWFGPWELNGDIRSQRETYRRLSPMSYVDRVTTPTLVLHGEADDRCPIGQSEELYIGLVAAGRVPTEFVRYPGGSHLFILSGRPSHRVDYCRRVVEWVTKYASRD